jgi:hypothetical protein
MEHKSRNAMRNWISRLGWRLVRKTCRHEQKEVTFEDYPDRCVHYWCDDCKQKLYEEM